MFANLLASKTAATTTAVNKATSEFKQPKQMNWNQKPARPTNTTLNFKLHFGDMYPENEDCFIN